MIHFKFVGIKDMHNIYYLGLSGEHHYPLGYLFIRSICLVHMNVFAKFDEILSIILQDIKETKRYGRTVGRT